MLILSTDRHLQTRHLQTRHLHRTLNLASPNGANPFSPRSLIHVYTESPIFINGSILHLALLLYVLSKPCPKDPWDLLLLHLFAKQAQHFLLGPSWESPKSSPFQHLFLQIYAPGVNFTDITSAVLLFFVTWRTRPCPLKGHPEPSALWLQPLLPSPLCSHAEF